MNSQVYSQNYLRKGGRLVSVIGSDPSQHSVPLTCLAGAFEEAQVYLPYGFVKPVISGCKDVGIAGTGREQSTGRPLFWALSRDQPYFWAPPATKSTTFDLGASLGVEILKVGHYPGELVLRNMPTSTRLGIVGTTHRLEVRVKPEETDNMLDVVIAGINQTVSLSGISNVHMLVWSASKVTLDSRSLKFLSIEGARDLDLSIPQGGMERLEDISAARATGQLKFSAEQTRSLTMAGSQGPNAIKLGGEGDVILATGDVDDVVYTGAGNDYVRTGKGDDVISPGAGRNFVETGKGHDLVVIARPEHSVLPSVKEKMLTTITDFDPANDILRFAFLREGRLLDHDRTLILEQEVATSNASTLEDAAATMRTHMNTNEVAALHWDGITYVLVDNAEQTTVRLHGVVDIQPDSITFG